MEINLNIKSFFLFYIIISFALTSNSSVSFSNKNQENDRLLTFTKKGIIKLKSNQSEKIIQSHNFPPLISTKINVKNLNFEEENILPGEDGGLYLINIQKEQYKLLNISIPQIVDLYDRKPLPNDKGYFQGNKNILNFKLDTTTGELTQFHSKSMLLFDVKENTGNIIYIKRIDYYLQMIYHQSIIAWNVSLSVIEVSNNASIFNSQSDVYPIEICKDEEVYIYKYISKEGKFERVLKEVSLHSFSSFHNIPARIQSFLTRLYINVFLYGCSAFGTLFLLMECGNNKGNKTEKRNSINKEGDDKRKEKQNENISLYSTKEKSLLNRSFDYGPFEKKNSLSFCFSLKYSELHKRSAPEMEYRKQSINFSDIECKNNNCNDEMNLQLPEEELAANKGYRMKKIEKRKSCILIKRDNEHFSPAKDDFFSNKTSLNNILHIKKPKFILTQKQIDEIYKIYSDSQKEMQSTIMFSFDKCEDSSNGKKYIELYDLIDKVNLRERKFSFDEFNDFYQNNQSLALCDNGRFFSNFEKIELIRKDNFSGVFKAMHKIDGCYYTVKIIKLNISLKENLSKIKEVQDIKSIINLENKNIIRYHTCWFEYKDPNLLSKRGRALSMDEKEIKKMNFPSKKKDNSLTHSSNSEYELVITEKEDEVISDNELLFNKELYLNTIEKNSDDEDSFLDNSIHNIKLIKKNDMEKEKDNEDTHSLNNVNIAKFQKQQNNSIPLYFFMQMEYCEGCTLQYYLQRREGKTDEKIIISMFFQIARGLRHIHCKGIIHRDLNPSNIFMNKKYKIKIGNFGLSADKKFNNNFSKEFDLYQSPESIKGIALSKKVDIYSLGIILSEMCLYFKNDNERDETIKKIKNGQYPDELKTYPNEMNLIRKMIKEFPSARPSIEEILESREMKQLINKV